jgi:hypothetical protein
VKSAGVVAPKADYPEKRQFDVPRRELLKVNAVEDAAEERLAPHSDFPYVREGRVVGSARAFGSPPGPTPHP